MLTKKERINCKKKIKRYNAVANISGYAIVLIMLFLCGIVDFGENGVLGIMIMTSLCVILAIIAWFCHKEAKKHVSKIRVDNFNRKRESK